MRNRYPSLTTRAVFLSLFALAMLPLISCSKNKKEMKNYYSSEESGKIKQKINLSRKNLINDQISMKMK